MSENILESSKLYELWAWYESNRKRVNTWAIIITVIGVAIAYAIWSAGQKQLNANTAVFSLGEPISVIAGGKVAPADLLKVAEQYKGTSAAERAVMEAGALYFQNGDYQKALDTFTQFTKDYPQSDLSATAAYGLAVCQDALGKDNEAEKAYQGLIQSQPTLATLAQINLAALYESKNQPDKAVTLYDEIARSPQRSWASAASDKARMIRIEHPELVEKTEAPKAAATPKLELKTNSVAAPKAPADAVPPMLQRPPEAAPAAPAPAAAPAAKPAQAPATPAAAAPAAKPAEAAPAK